MTTVNITTSTTTINNYNSTDKTITPNTGQLDNSPLNVYIPTKVGNTCRTIKYVAEFNKDNQKQMVIELNVKLVLIIAKKIL